MTYNPNDWQVGDIVMMELDLTRVTGDAESRARNEGRQVRLLCRRVGGRHNGRLMWQGAHGAVVADMGNRDSVVYIERLVPLTVAEADRANNQPAPAYPRQSATWSAASSAPLRHSAITVTAN